MTAPSPPEIRPTPALVSEAAPKVALPLGGFLTSDSELLPKNIREAAGSVFEIYVPLAQSAVDFDVTLWNARKVRSEIEASQLTVNAKIAAIKQIEACERDKGYWGRSGLGDSTCKISLSFLRASAFVTDGGTLLWTSWRILKHALGITASVRAVTTGEETRPTAPFFVFAGQGHLAFDSTMELARPERFHADADKKYFTYIYVPNADYIALRLPRPLGLGLKIATQRPVTGETVFALGVPDCTNCGYPADDHDHADRIPYPNADGKTVRITSGTIEKTPDISLLRPLNIAESAQFSGEPLMFAEIDGNFGMLGGPMLNANGEVIALTSYMKNIVSDGRIRRTSLVVQPPDIFSLDPADRHTVDNSPRNESGAVVEALGGNSADGI